MPLILSTPVRPNFTLESTTPPPPPNSFPARAQPLSPPSLTIDPTRTALESTQGRIGPTKPLLFLQPASPARERNHGGNEFPIASTSLEPSPAVSGLATRRSKNMKMLSLVVPASASSSSLNSPATPGVNDPWSETRSLPPSPISLTAYVGVEGAEEEDRTIGRLMMKQQVEEMREQMKGGRGMKRRTSIPRLNLGSSATGSYMNRAGSNEGSGSAVRLIRRDNIERIPAAYTSPNSYFPPSAASTDVDAGLPEEMEEEFPYEHGPREILPGIWLGSELNARDPKVLKRFGIRWILNVAKEVVCPWIAEMEEVGSASMEMSRSGSGRSGGTSSTASTSSLRPLFIRPTTSTPNLRSAFTSSFSSAPSPILEDPSSPLSPSPAPLDPLLARTRPPTPLKSLSTSTTTTPLPSPPLTSSVKSINFPANWKTGRPELEYLWLRWGHDESDLVEAGKFGTAFDFIDRAKEAGGNVLIQCQCGVSRSATVMIGYCMREASRALNEGEMVAEGLSEVTGMHSAYSFVKEKSAWVGPNLNLVFQLVAYERTLRGSAPTTEAEGEEDYPHQTEEEGSATSPDDADDATTFSVDSTSTQTTASRSEEALDEGGDEMECDMLAEERAGSIGEYSNAETIDVGEDPPSSNGKRLSVDTSAIRRPLSTASDISFTSSSSTTDIVTPTVTLDPTTLSTTAPKPIKHSRTQSLFTNLNLKEYTRSKPPSSAPHFSAPLPSLSTSDSSPGGGRRKEENHFFPPSSFVLPRSSSLGGTNTTTDKLHTLSSSLSSSQLSRPGMGGGGKKSFGNSESVQERRDHHRRVFSVDVVPKFSALFGRKAVGGAGERSS